MRLKKIKLAGFKSFVDPTVLEMQSDLVAVVGPNGCGKSNVIDAVRWVMGESSAKHLRGESLSDVIFNGSAGRKPVGQASVELMFDNSDGSLGGEYSSFAEISIRREATRDNQSSYYLNGVKCRRRDITEIFMGTGLGPRSYAIIEQGMISRVIESKPEELRSFFEEAAGVSLYRKKRQETETRMRHTRENLARLDDVRQELEKQLERLKRQSEAAERYKLYKDEQETLEIELTGLRYFSLTTQLQEKNLVQQKQATALEEKMAGKTSCDLSLEKAREEQSEQADEFNTIQSRYYSMGSEITRHEQNLQNLKDRENTLKNELAETEKSLSDLKAQLALDIDLLQTLTEKVNETEPLQKEASKRVEDHRLVVTQAEEAIRQWTTGFELFQEQAEAPNRISEVEKARIEQLDRQASDADKQLKQYRQEAIQLEENLKATTTQELEKTVSDKENEAKIRAETLAELSSRLSDFRQKQVVLNTEVETTRNKKHELQGRLVSLEALQAAALTKTDKALNHWLETEELSHNKRLIEQLKVESGYEKAVETVFGFALEAICLKNERVAALSDLSKRLASLTSGNLYFILDELDKKDNVSATSVEISKNLAANLLSSKVTLLGSNSTSLNSSSGSAFASIEHLLRDVFVVDDMQTALQLHPQLKGCESVITRDGIWCGSNWLRVHKGTTEKTGTIAREAEIKQLTEQLQKITEALSQQSLTYDNNKQNIHSVEQERESLLKVEHTESQGLKQLSNRLSHERARFENTRLRLSRLQEDIAGLTQKLTLNQEETAVSRITLQTAIDQMADFSERRTRLLNERDLIRAALAEASQALRSAQEEAHALALKYQALTSQKEASHLGIERLKQHCHTTNDRTHSIQTALEESIQPQQALRETLEVLLGKRLEEEGILNEARTELDALEQELRRLEKLRTQYEQEAEGLRNELENTRLACQTVEVRRQTLQEKLTELGIGISNAEDIQARIPAEANEEDWTKNLEQVTQKIQRLGAINLAAIEEYQTESERKTYLDSQHQDLTEALETLEQAIRKIDRETRSQFKETFDRVSTEFQNLFPQLFGGGQAYLELQGEDLLEAGVTVMARPPGKKNSSIHLLSGGEKALTAVALVFAIFKLNPAPFCMLDEVDAPLDDFNVGRFSQLVAKLSSSVQFIFVTHNKITMEIAQHLVGVTMKEPGVSRLVSVNVAEALEMAS